MRTKRLLNFKGFLSFLILHELSISRLSGDQLAQKIGSRKGSKLTPGTIYPTLKKLRLLKLVSYRRVGRNKTYFLTDIGKGELTLSYSAFSRYFIGLKKYIKRQKVNK